MNDQNNPINEDDEEGSASGSQSSDVNFRYQDILSTGPRDDLLPPEEINRRLVVHQDTHKEQVDKQKLKRKEREALKKGQASQIGGYSALGGVRQGGAGGRASPYKKHPIADKFSGMADPQVMSLPSENQADTNMAEKNQLQNQLQLQAAPRYVPPKLRPY